MAHAKSPDSEMANSDTAKGIRHFIDDQLDKTLETLASDVPIHERVHDVRKRFKKVRAALRLAREPLGDHYRAGNVLFRDAGRSLSDIRDAQVMVETLAWLREEFHDVLSESAFDDIQRRMERRRDALTETMELGRVLDELADVVAEGRRQMERWEWSHGTFEDLRPGLIKSFERGRRAMKAAYESNSEEVFHLWRKRAKYHRHHVQILYEGWTEVLEPERDKLHELTDSLGHDHDLAVLLDRIENDEAVAPSSATARALRGLSDAESAALRAAARPLGELLYGEPSDVMADRMYRVWRYA